MTTPPRTPAQGHRDDVSVADAADTPPGAVTGRSRPTISSGQQPSAGEEQRSVDLMRSVTSIGSPVALATALLFYFGWVRSEAEARAFGADASVFAMSTEDYVLRSVNVLFFPVILLLLAGLLVLRLDRKLRRAPRAPRWLPALGRALQFSWALFLAIAAVLYAMAGTFGDVTLPLWVALSILGPVYGTVLRREATGERSRFSRVALALVVSLLTVSLFWQTERLARLGGEALAQDVKTHLEERLPQVELFSAKDLQITGPGVATIGVGGADAAYGYRYSGLYLLQRSGEKYFLLTGGWESDRGRLLVIPDTPSIRVEFRRD